PRCRPPRGPPAPQPSGPPGGRAPPSGVPPSPPPATTRLRALQLAFLAILPRIERHGRVYFRHVRCPDRKADAIREMVALCWKWFRRLAERGKDATRFPSVLATFAARAVYNGRRLAGTCKAKDVLSPAAQRRHGFQVG